MPGRQVDPSRLEGDALARWYRRSLQEIEQERQVVRNQAYDAFFAPTRLGQVVRPAAANTSAPNGVADCIGCHGRIPPPFSFPFPIDGFPIFREGSSRLPSKPTERDRKQCDLQYASDTDVCVGQVNEESKAVCRESAANRLAHCSRYGECRYTRSHDFSKWSAKMAVIAEQLLDQLGSDEKVAVRLHVPYRSKERGVSEIGLSISLPSRKFYESLGYEVVEDVSRDLGEGQRLDYWQAVKQLSD